MSSRDGSHFQSPHTLGRVGVLAIVVAAAVVVFALLGFRSALNEHEIFAAEPARELLEGGSLVLQQFAGEYRTKKPPGQSWLIAASLFITQSRSEYAARLPSALAATGLALLAGMIAARLRGRRVGIIAGLMTLTCYAVQIRSRLAEADMTLALFVALSFAGVLLPLLRHRRAVDATSVTDHELPFRPAAYGFLFWLPLGVAFLIKGPIALMFVLPPVIVLWLLTRFRTTDHTTLKIIEMVVLNPYALVLALLMILGWPVAAYWSHPEVLSQWKYELASRAIGEIRRDPIWSYAAFVPLGTLPWCLFCFAMLDRRASLRRPVEALLALWLVIGFVLLTFAIAFKAMHYCLPILFPILILSAIGFDRVLTQFSDRFVKNESRRPALAATCIVAWFVVVGSAWLVNQAVFEPKQSARAGLKLFAAAIHERVPRDVPIYLIAVGEERIAWYVANRSIQTRRRDDESLDQPITRLPDGVVFAICPATRVEELRPLVKSLEVLETSADYRGRADGSEKRALVRIEAR